MSAVNNPDVDALANAICDETFSSSHSADRLIHQLEKLHNLDIPTRIKCVWKISDIVDMSSFLEVLHNTQSKNLLEISDKEWDSVLRVLHTLSCISDVPNLCSVLVRNRLFLNMEKLFSLILAAKDMKEIHYAIISQLGIVSCAIVRSCKTHELNIFMKSNVLKQMILSSKKLTKSSPFGSSLIAAVDKIIQNIVYVGGGGKQANQKTVSEFFKRSHVSDLIQANLASPQTVVAVRMQSSLLYRPANLTKRSSLTKLAFESIGSEDPYSCSNPECKKNEGTEKRKFAKCSRCRTVKYCSKQCQKKDWKAHSENCQPSRKSA